MKKNLNLSTTKIALIPLFSSLISVCAWISVPSVVPFTMQTFAVFCTCGILGGQLGGMAILVYIFIGAIGLPVFSGFTGGMGALLGTSGGYIMGFIVLAYVYGLITRFFGKKTWSMVCGMLVGLLACYTFGTAWFIIIYTKNIGNIGIIAALDLCVFPFIIPDLLKLIFAVFVSKRIGAVFKALLEQK